MEEKSVNLYTFIAQFYNKYKLFNQPSELNEDNIKKCLKNISDSIKIGKSEIEEILYTFVSKKTIEANIFSVLKQVHPDNIITKNAMKFLTLIYGQFILYFSNYLSNITIENFKYDIDYTIEHLIFKEIKEKIGGQISKHVINEMNKALQKYKAYKPHVAKENFDDLNEDISYKSALYFSVPNVILYSEQINLFPSFLSKKSKKLLGIAITAYIEYFFAEILELSGNKARDEEQLNEDQLEDKGREIDTSKNKLTNYDFSWINGDKPNSDELAISIKNIKDAIMDDEELNSLYKKIFGKNINKDEVYFIPLANLEN